MLTAIVVVPSTPLVLAGHPGRRHAAIAELGLQIDRAVSELAGCSTVVILAGGPRGSGIRVRTNDEIGHPGTAMRLGYGIGLQSADAEAAVARTGTGRAERIAAAARIIRRRSVGALHTATDTATDMASDTAADLDAGWADADVLAVHSAQVAPSARLVMVSVAADTNPSDAREVAAPITQEDESQTALLVAGDLSAGHGTKPPRPGATIVFDDQILGALDSGQPDRLLHVSEELATHSESRAAGALRMLGAVLDESAMGMVVRWSGAPLGVGYLVAVGR